MKLFTLKNLAWGFFFGLGVVSANGQVSYDALGSTYTQTFDNASGWATGTVNATLAWADNTTFAGWYASYYYSTTSTYTTPSLVMQSNGTQNTANSLYIFRSTTDLTDGALGAIPINAQTNAVGVGGVYYGVAITNNTGSAITSFTLGYTMEEWRISSATNNSITVSYSVDATSLSTGTWTSVSSLTTTSDSSAYASSTIILDGNSSSNQSLVSTLITLEAPLAASSTIWIRWFDDNTSGTDDGIGIDNVMFTATAVPEPATAAALLGVSVLGLAVLRRSRRSAV